MAKTGEEVVYEGWLTKSPPTKRIWRAKWRRRWFSLKHSQDIPNQYILTYYADRNCRKLKGFIDLDTCEQVDLGLKLDERKLKFDHVFDIKTPTRTYYLAADTEHEMKSWVNCICSVCGLKASDEDEANQGSSEVDYCEEDKDKQPSETPPISPVSTSPYIPISECITGKSPILNPEDIKLLFQHGGLKQALLESEMNETHLNQTYGVSQRNYLNYVNDMQDPRFYDRPRDLAPVPHRNENIATNKAKNKNSSPLQSPTDTESVFTDDDTGDIDVYVTKKYTKVHAVVGDEKTAPPRPPKSAHVVPSSSYMNLNSTKSNEVLNKEQTGEDPQRIITDDMYDFPRSHNVETEIMKSLQRRHCYNNAAPGKVEGQVFRYDISPKPSTSQVFTYEEGQEEPTSPASHTSSTPGYSNLPSPLLADSLMPPPAVNRGLKPKRKLSDTLSSSSNPEPSSPRGAPCIDRKLKPPTPLQEGRKLATGVSPTLSLGRTRDPSHSDHDARKLFSTYNPRRNGEDDRRRAAPSPTPPGLAHSCESLLSYNADDTYKFLPGKMQYLDLDLEKADLSAGPSGTAPCKGASESSTVYKQVDFKRTQAFNLTKINLEKERKEPVSFTKNNK